MVKEASQVVCPSGSLGAASLTSLACGRGLGWGGGAGLGGVSFYSHPYSSAHRLGTENWCRWPSFQRWVLGCMVLAPGLL